MLLELLWMLIVGTSSGELNPEESATVSSVIRESIEMPPCGHHSCGLYWAIQQSVQDRSPNLH